MMQRNDKIGSDGPPSRREAARFLIQATLGPTPADIDRACSLGFAGWIEDQFQSEPSVTHQEIHRARVAGLHFELHHAWWRQVLTADDLLRQRVAVALTEIFVVSEMSIEFVPWEMMKYYDELGKLSFGNWRGLLRMVALNPVMGHYLSHLRNRKADAEERRHPDENFAREVLQLFSIGLWELNPDGTRRLDARGREIPAYDNAEVTSFARVFTGFGFGGPAADEGRPGDFLNAIYDYGEPMKLWEEEHDQAEKQLLGGRRLPAFSAAPGRKAMDDIEDALDNIFQHPNVGPFFGRLMIQRLVCSNPSPDYVRRVAQAFADNGSGVRGDMRALIRAILLDPEARDAAPRGAGAGRLHEPYLRYVRLARTFRARSEEGSFRIHDHETLKLTNQIFLNSPTVFNFFLPDYQPPGRMAEAGLCAPEFQIMTSSTAITSLNCYTRMVQSGFGDDTSGPGVMRLDFREEIELAGDPAALIESLDLKMTAGGLSPETRRILSDACAEMTPDYPPEEKVKALVQLIAISPDFAVSA